MNIVPFSDTLPHVQEHEAHDPDTRRKVRALLHGAGLADCAVLLSMRRDDGRLRHMHCTPVPSADAAGNYVTVCDLDMSDQAGRAIFRRVALDSVVAAVVDYRSAA